MNILSFLGRKFTPKQKLPRRPATTEKYEDYRLNTEIQQLKDRPVIEKLHSQVNVCETMHATGKADYTKLTVNKDTMTLVLKTCKQTLQQDLDRLSHYQHEAKVRNHTQAQFLALHFFLLKTNFFRYQPVTHSKCLQSYRKLLEALDLIVEKTFGSQNVLNDKGKIFVLNEEEFCQFFKMLFGRPVKVFNQSFVRKVVLQLWHCVFFNEKQPARVANILRQWLHGISLPTNPTRVRLHRAVFQEDTKFLEKACALKLNSPIYCHINESDPLGITPIMLCIYLKKQKFISTLLLLGANPLIVPLTKLEDPEKCFEDIKSAVLKNKMSEFAGFNIKISPYQRLTKSCIEYVRDINELKIMAHLIGLEQTKNIYSFKQATDLFRKIQQIPDFSMQMAWKIESKFNLVGGPPPSDVITIYKRKGNVRVDFNLINVFSNKVKPERGKYSFIFKEKPDLTLVFIDHRNRKIVDLFGEASVEDIEKRAEVFIKQGDKQNEVITQLIAEEKVVRLDYGQSGRKINFNAYFEYQNIKKEPPHNYNNITQYERAINESNIVDYAQLSASQSNYIRKEIVGENCKVSRKKCQSKMSFQVTTVPYFDLNLDHLNSLIKLLRNCTNIFDRVGKFIDLQQQLFDIGRKSIYTQFPMKASFDLSLGVSIQINFQNFNFSTPRQEIFELDSKLDDFEQQRRPEQNFQKIHGHGRSISVESQLNVSFSKFLHAGDQTQQEEYKQACKKYEMLLASTNDSQFVEVISNYSSLNNSLDLSERARSKRNQRAPVEDKIQGDFKRKPHG